MDWVYQIERAMRQAQAHDVALAFARSCHEVLGATDVELYLADCRCALLKPIIGQTAALDINGEQSGECFRDQVVIQRDGRCHLPVSVRGDRLGVVSMSVAQQDEQQLAELGEVVAQAVALAQSATDRYRIACRADRMTLAAEIQWDLLPTRSVRTESFELGGQLEPAYELAGDSFDWSSDDEGLTVSVTNGSHWCPGATALHGLATMALRNARRAGLNLAQQAALADQAVWGEFGGKTSVPTLLLHFGVKSAELTVVDAGSPHLWRFREGRTEVVELEQQLPLGMFEETRYETQQLPIRRGDRFFVFSDGLLDATIDQNAYGCGALTAMISATAELSPSEVTRRIIADVLRFHCGEPLRDDAIVVCVDVL